MLKKNFKFIPPPEAPVFYPTVEEFEDPLTYISKIKPIGVKTGICKIIPPKGWNPPFAVSIDSFHFTPRVQRLYELEAHSRLKLDFISRLYQFGKLHGSQKLKIPSIGGKYLDIFWLHKYVEEAGGYEKVTSTNSWPTIAERMGHQGGRYAWLLKSNYEKILLPFDVNVNSESILKMKRQHESSNSIPKKRTRIVTTNVEPINYNFNKELKNLRFFGPGPKAAVPVTKESTSPISKKNTCYSSCRVCELDSNEANLLICSNASCQACYHTFCLVPSLSKIPKWQWRCPDCIRKICCRPMEQYGFPQSTRIYSLQEFGIKANSFKSQYFRQDPSSVPCATVECEFWRILQEYTEDVIVEYGADIHSSDQGSGFPTEVQIQTCPDMYPKDDQKRKALEYARSPWNLNNLPVYGNSVLRFIKGNIDGMKVPWCYVGMVFSTFCWHIEDHWSCSINFNHWGEPKTWYGVPSSHADDFERAIKKQAPELFELSPDLLHHITTIMNPNILEAEGVPIYRTDQQCGEFVITFPRAYHAGFNQGLNFAEAVNICGPDWLPMGRECVDHYATMKRQCVFSNDELMMILAEVVGGLRDMKDVTMWTDLTAKRFRNVLSTGFDLESLRTIQSEFCIVASREIENRRKIAKRVHKSEHVRLDELSDDERICSFCQTTLFFSGLICSCVTSKSTERRTTINLRKTGQHEYSHTAPQFRMVCLNHVDMLCNSCRSEECTLKYTYTIEELEFTMKIVATKLCSFQSWYEELCQLLHFRNAPSLSSSCFNTKPDQTMADKTKQKHRMTLAIFEKKMKDAATMGYHTNPLFQRADSYLKSVKELLTICDKASELISGEFDPAQDKSCSIATFQLKKSTTFTFSSQASATKNSTIVIVNHEIDWSAVKEVDLLRLMESIEQKMDDIYLDEIPSIMSLRRLFSRVGEWRTLGKEAVINCRKLLNSGLQEPDKDTNKYINSVQSVRVSLTDLSDSIKSEFPGWCKNMDDFRLLILLKEVCAWLLDSNYFSETTPPLQPSRTVADFRKHVAIGETLIEEITAAESSSSLATRDKSLLEQNNPRIATTRALRSLSSAKIEIKSTTTRLTSAFILASAHPLVRLIRARLHTVVGSLSQILVDIDSTIPALLEKIQFMHVSPRSGCETLISRFHRLGIISLGKPVGDLRLPGLAQQIAHYVSLNSPKHVSSSPIDKFSCVCCSPEKYAECVEVADEIQSDDSKVIFWWSLQLVSISCHGAKACPQRKVNWLCDVTDLHGIQRFILGEKEGISSSWVPLDLLAYQQSFENYCSSVFSGTLILAQAILPNCSELPRLLPIEIYNIILQALIPRLLPEEKRKEILAIIQTEIMKQALDDLDATLTESEKLHQSILLDLLNNEYNRKLCSPCCRRLHLPVPSESINLLGCLLCKTESISSYSISMDILQTLSESSDFIEPEYSSKMTTISDLLIAGERRCLHNLLNRYNRWMEEVVSVLDNNRYLVSNFLDDPCQASLRERLPKQLSVRFSQLRQNIISTNEAPDSVDRLRIILASGIAFGSRAFPASILELLNGVLAVLSGSNY